MYIKLDNPTIMYIFVSNNLFYTVFVNMTSSGVRVGHGWVTAQGAGYKGVLAH